MNIEKLVQLIQRIMFRSIDFLLDLYYAENEFLVIYFGILFFLFFIFVLWMWILDGFFRFSVLIFFKSILNIVVFSIRLIKKSLLFLQVVKSKFIMQKFFFILISVFKLFSVKNWIRIFIYCGIIIIIWIYSVSFWYVIFWSFIFIGLFLFDKDNNIFK